MLYNRNMSDIVTSKEAQEINKAINQEDRAILDHYIDLLIDGDMNPIETMCAKTKAKRSTIGRFLAIPEHKAYVTEKLDYWLTCVDVDRYRILEDLRIIASANIVDYFYIRNGQLTLKNENDIPKQLWRAVKKIKINNYGLPELELHSKQGAQTLLAKLHKMLATDINVNTKVEHRDRLFDLPSANNPSSNDNSPIDATAEVIANSIFDDMRIEDKDDLLTASDVLRDTSKHHIDLPTQRNNTEKAKSFVDWSNPKQFYFDDDDGEGANEDD